MSLQKAAVLCYVEIQPKSQENGERLTGHPIPRQTISQSPMNGNDY